MNTPRQHHRFGSGMITSLRRPHRGESEASRPARHVGTQLWAATMALSLVAFCLHSPKAVAAVSFSDDFEAASLDPFWTVEETAGSVVFPGTSQAHGGSQSVTFDVSAGDQNYLFLRHTLPQLSYGAVSVWVFDPNADQGNYFGLYLTSSSVHLDLQTFNWDGSQYHYALTSSSFDTFVTRTVGWHRFEIESSAASLNMWIDGVPVYSGLGGEQFDTIRLGLYGRDAAAVPFFDDFEFTEQAAIPEPAFYGLALGSLAIVFSAWRRRAVDGLRGV